MATYTTSTFSGATLPQANFNERVIPWTITIAGALANGQTIDCCKIPAGYVPVGVSVRTSAGVATTGGTIKIGINDSGVIDDDDWLLASTTATAAINLGVQDPAVHNRRTTQVSSVYATLGGSSGFTSGTTLSGLVVISPFATA